VCSVFEKSLRFFGRECIIFGIYAKFWGFYAVVWKIMHTFAADLAKSGSWTLSDAESVDAV
jgi:hypothetical protein